MSESERSDTYECDGCGRDVETTWGGLCWLCAEEQSSNGSDRCPVCGEDWGRAHPNLSNARVACSQAETFCLTDDAVYIHGDSYER